MNGLKSPTKDVISSRSDWQSESVEYLSSKPWIRLPVSRSQPEFRFYTERVVADMDVREFRRLEGRNSIRRKGRFPKGSTRLVVCKSLELPLLWSLYRAKRGLIEVRQIKGRFEDMCEECPGQYRLAGCAHSVLNVVSC